MPDDFRYSDASMPCITTLRADVYPDEDEPTATMNIGIESTGLFIAQTSSFGQTGDRALAEASYDIISGAFWSSSIAKTDTDEINTGNMLFHPRNFNGREQAVDGMTRIIERRMSATLSFNRHLSEMTAGSWGVLKTLSKFGMKAMHDSHRTMKDSTVFARSFANQFLRNDMESYARLTRSLDLLEDSADAAYRTHMDHLSNRLNAITGIVAMGALGIAVLSVGVSIALAFLRPTEVARMLGIQLLPREGLTRAWHTTPT